MFSPLSPHFKRAQLQHRSQYHKTLILKSFPRIGSVYNMMKMGSKGGSQYMGLWVLLMLLNQLVLPVLSIRNTKPDTFQDEKNYYTPDPHVIVPHTPSGSHSSPSHSPTHHKSSHHGSGSGSSQSNCNTPPRSSGGSGHYYPSPVPTPPTPSGGGCRCPSPPLVPSPHPIPTPTPTPPRSSGGSGGYYRPPPTTPVVRPPPASPLVPSPPYVTPVTPIITPVTPIVPSPPLVPRTPTPYDPSRPPFPCTYWGSHPTLIFGVVGWWATVGGIFGVTTLPGLSSSDYTLQQVLNDPKRDGYSSLYREATASFLNSMATKSFPFSSDQVKTSVLGSLSTEKAAAAQARLFKLANEGRLK